jgi:tetratricopeptide (TPR) repeat protein
MEFVTNPRRDASPTIAGFVFQVNLTILQWLDLQNGERLELECGEDIDVVDDNSNGVSRETRLLQQLKARTGRSVTLRSAESLEALSNYCEHRADNPNSRLKFRYITTAGSGFEQDWNRAESGIETWIALQQGRYGELDRSESIAAIRTLLTSCHKPPKASASAWSAFQKALSLDDEAELTDIILGFEWGVGYGDYSQIQRQVISALSGPVYKLPSADTNTTYEHLFAFVFRLLCQPGSKRLTSEMLAAELLNPAVTPSDIEVLRSVREELDQINKRITSVEGALPLLVKDVNVLKQSVGLIGKAFGHETTFSLTTISFSLGAPELVSPCLPRKKPVSEILDHLRKRGSAVLVAEPGSGKTQLLLLAVARDERPVHWLNLPRDVTEAQACTLLDSLIQLLGGQLAGAPFRESYDSASEQLRGSIVVIDDLPRILPRGQLAQRIERLARTLKNVEGGLLVSSYFPLPATTEESLGNTQYRVPRFTAADVAELLAIADAPSEPYRSTTSSLLVVVSEGLPTLVMSAVRYLAAAHWQFTLAEIESLCRGEFAAPHRLDANELLQITVPDAEERELLARLSLAVGPFSMEDIAHVARVRKSISLPGEKVKRSTGVWLQQIANEQYLRSPLITSALAESLDPGTRKGVHFVLAFRILARKTLSPIEALTCVNHFNLAQQVFHAVMVVIQTLAAYIDLDEPTENDLGFAHMWPSSDSLTGIDLNLQINLRSAQVVVLAKQGRDVTAQLANFDKLVLDLGGTGWGVAVAAAGLAIHIVWSRPIEANKYVLLSLATFPEARLPDGSPLPSLGKTPFEHILWISAYNCKSDADVDSWLATLTQLTREQMDTLKTSELMEDNITILCDGIWMRVYRRPEAERDWAPVTSKLSEIEATARKIDFPLLEVSAMRTRITVIAELEKRVDEALALAESSLVRFSGEDCRFLILEVMGRQLSYAGRKVEAIAFLERSIACEAYRSSILRRNVLITLAELSVENPSRATELTAEAVKLCTGTTMFEPATIESLAEHGIALSNEGKTAQSLEAFEEATNRLLAIRSDKGSWKGLLARVFGAIAYFSSIAYRGQPENGQVEFKQGVFLSSNEEASSAYRTEQLSYICIRLAMFADGVEDIRQAAAWTWKAIEFAKEDPSALNVVRSCSWHALPAALVSNDFVRAAQLVDFMTAVDASTLIEAVKANPQLGATAKQIAQLQASISSAPNVPNSLKSSLAIVPVVARLATLQLEGRNVDAIAESLAAIENVIPRDSQTENFVEETKRALLDGPESKTLWKEGVEANRRGELVRAFILCIGAVCKAAPVSQSLVLQIWLAQNLEGFYNVHASVYREIIAPFFVAYWKRATTEYAGAFRTALAYTLQQINSVNGSPNGIRKLLRSMAFCLGVTLPAAQTAWLEASE